MSQRRNGTDAYSRALKDPAFLAAVTAAYDGRYPVLDALWWLSHPGESAPSGATAPSTTLAELRRRIYSAAGDGAGDARATHELRRQEQQLTAERHAAEDAVTAADAPGPPVRGDGVDLEDLLASPHLNDVHEPEEPAQLAEEPPHTTPPGTPRKRILVASGIVAALIVGLVVGIQLTKPEADATTSEAPSVASSADAVLEVHPVAAAEIFDLVQQPSDVPTQDLPATFVEESFRALSPVGTPGALAGIFAARSTSNMICILVLLPDEKYTSNCTVESEFPTTGLRVYWAEDIDIEVDGETSTTETLDLSAIWKAGGEFSVSGSGR